MAIPWENLVAGDSWLEWDLAIADWGKRDPLLSLALDLKKLRCVLKDRAVSGTTVLIIHLALFGGGTFLVMLASQSRRAPGSRRS